MHDLWSRRSSVERERGRRLPERVCAAASWSGRCYTSKIAGAPLHGLTLERLGQGTRSLVETLQRRTRTGPKAPGAGTRGSFLARQMLHEQSRWRSLARLDAGASRPGCTISGRDAPASNANGAEGSRSGYSRQFPREADVTRAKSLSLPCPARRWSVSTRVLTKPSPIRRSKAVFACLPLHQLTFTTISTHTNSTCVFHS
ncbi:hypothetical protein SAMN05444359_10510 [Neolewinella agarilytica]|uniref:Uncharacterized protein n=1 Tax=Neolewinella agarilytica TaxID=478744 RepID=A0A1H9CTG0_9BACT|nr:hypothetical protein SAMN05444359_10510 [Neolewinella agarilytica]